MFINIYHKTLGDGPELVTKCPSCGHDATFLRIGVKDVHSNADAIWLGQRMCPNPVCFNHIFYTRNKDGILATFPPLRIDFERQGIPKKVLSVFEEAITCHANQCFIAAAIMIRKTLEEICIDRGATGDNLKIKN